MHQFTLSRPADISAAIAAHAQDAHVVFIAGGTDLIGLMKDRATFPERLLDLNRLPDMSYIDVPSGGGLRIGALARMSDVAAHFEVRSRFPVIRRESPVRRFGPAPKYGHHRREHHATNSLCVLPGRG